MSINLRELEALRQRAKRACEDTQQLLANVREILTKYGLRTHHVQPQSILFPNIYLYQLGSALGDHLMSNFNKL